MAAAYIDTFVRYSDRNAEGGFIRANGDYSFTMSDHPARVHNARLEAISFATHGFTLVKHATDVDFSKPEDVHAGWSGSSRAPAKCSRSWASFAAARKTSAVGPRSARTWISTRPASAAG